jgi:hypothetical protein
MLAKKQLGSKSKRTEQGQISAKISMVPHTLGIIFRESEGNSLSCDFLPYIVRETISKFPTLALVAVLYIHLVVVVHVLTLGEFLGNFTTRGEKIYIWKIRPPQDLS